MHLSKIERLRKRVAHELPLKPHYVALKQGVVTICFDDFARNSWTIGGAVLSHYGATASYFASGGLCSRTIERLDYFTLNDLQDVWSSGNEIGCHTFDHISAVKSSPSDFERSIMKNKAFLANALPQLEVSSFAYPYNHTSLRCKLFIKRYFNLARGVGRKTNAGWADFSELSAINLSRSSVSAAGQRGEYMYDLGYFIERAATRKEWLVVYTHDVSDTPTDHGCPTSGLEALIIRAKQAGLDIRAMKDVPSLLSN